MLNKTSRRRHLLGARTLVKGFVWEGYTTGDARGTAERIASFGGYVRVALKYRGRNIGAERVKWYKVCYQVVVQSR